MCTQGVPPAASRRCPPSKFAGGGSDGIAIDSRIPKWIPFGIKEVSLAVQIFDECMLVGANDNNSKLVTLYYNMIILHGYCDKTIIIIKIGYRDSTVLLPNSYVKSQQQQQRHGRSCKQHVLPDQQHVPPDQVRDGRWLAHASQAPSCPELTAQDTCTASAKCMHGAARS